MALFSELRRRNVLKVALLYLIASWLVLWFVLNAGEALGLPPWFGPKRWSLCCSAVGFPVALSPTFMKSRRADCARRPASTRRSRSFTRPARN